MPLTVGVARWLASGSSKRVSCILPNHTSYHATLSLAGIGCWRGRRIITPIPHTIATTRHFSTRRGSSDGESKPLHSLTPQIDEKLGTLQPHPPAPKEDQVPLRVLGATGVSKGSVVVSKEGNKKPEDWNDILNRWYQQYQDFVGITDLKKAQDSVTELSDSLHSAQGERRRLQAEIEELQTKLVENHNRITKTEQYSQDHMRLFSEAGELTEKLRVIRNNFSQCEQTERETFTHLSAAIRDCHERERMQAEQSKYWSIIASVLSAALASVITSVNNWVRIREIKDHVTTCQQTLLKGYEQMHTDILASLAPQEPPQGQGISGELTKIIDNVSKATDGLVGSVKAALTASTTEEGVRNVSTPVGNAAVVSGGGGGDVSYPRVAATMMVGAALGTLITAFFLGALGGSGG